MRLGFERRRALSEIAREAREDLPVHHDAARFHPRQYRRQRPLDGLVKGGGIFRGQARLQHMPEPERNVGILGGIFGRGVERHLVEADLLRAHPAHRLIGDALMLEMSLRQFVEPVVGPPGIEVEAHHQRIVIGRDVDAGLLEHHPVIFEVVPDLEHRRVLEQRLQPVKDELQRKLVRGLRIEVDADMAHRNVAGAVRRRRQTDPGELGDDAVDAVGLGIDRDITLRARFGDRILAELRGVMDEAGNAPFWDGLAGRFFDMTFPEADEFNAVHGTQFIADLMPKTPIYVNMLPESARSVIGQPHPTGRAALKMLQAEGFIWECYVDIFDGGPTVTAPTDQIRTVREAEWLKVGGSHKDRGKTMMVATGQLGSFIACHAQVRIDDRGEALLDEKAMEMLDLGSGDTIIAVNR